MGTILSMLRAPSSPPPHAGVELVSTGQAARRRRQRLNRRQRKRADTDASSSGAHELNAANPDANPNAKNADSDAKNADSSATPGLYAASTAASSEASSSKGAAHPKIAEPASTDPNALSSDAKKQELCLDASAEAASSTGASDPKITEPTSTDPDELNPDAKKHEPCLDPSKTEASAEAAFSTGADDPKIAEPASTDPRALHLRTPAMDNGFLLDASPVADNDGLHGAALAVAATSTDQEWTTVPEKKRRAPPAPPRTQPRRPAAPAARSPAFAPRSAAAVDQQRLPAAPAARSPAFGPRGTPAPARTRPHLPAASAACSPAFAPRAPAATAVGQQRPHATAAVGLLDDLHGVDSMFGNLFQEAEDDHNCRMIHLRYRAACSTIESKFTGCLVCFLDDHSEKLTKVENKFDEMKKHLRARHSHNMAEWIKCPKKGCFTMARASDIALHRYYCH